MKIIPINQTMFVLIRIVCGSISKTLGSINVIDLDIFVVILSLFFIDNYIVYARVLDANKSRNIAHFVLSVNILALFSDALLGLSILVSFVFFLVFCFFEESLVIVIKYFDEDKAIKKIKKRKNFSEKEPLDLLIKTAREENKLKVLQYLEELKNGRN